MSEIEEKMDGEEIKCRGNKGSTIESERRKRKSVSGWNERSSSSSDDWNIWSREIDVVLCCLCVELNEIVISIESAIEE